MSAIFTYAFSDNSLRPYFGQLKVQCSRLFSRSAKCKFSGLCACENEKHVYGSYTYGNQSENGFKLQHTLETGVCIKI